MIAETAPLALVGSPFSLNLNEPRRPFCTLVANIFEITSLRDPSDASIASSITVAACAP